MNPDAASLDNLRDIVVPPPVPWWPPAAGWWVVMALLSGTLVVIIYRSWRTWQANAYRRAAIRELQSATTVAQVAAVLKRTALVAFPRVDIAALSGSAWFEWLGKTGAGRVSDSVALALTQGVFETVEAGDIQEVRAFASGWIKHHQVSHVSTQRELKA